MFTENPGFLSIKPGFSLTLEKTWVFSQNENLDRNPLDAKPITPLTEWLAQGILTAETGVRFRVYLML